MYYDQRRLLDARGACGGASCSLRGLPTVAECFSKGGSGQSACNATEILLFSPDRATKHFEGKQFDRPRSFLRLSSLSSARNERKICQKKKNAPLRRVSRIALEVDPQGASPDEGSERHIL
ncbi:hypothetical protein HPB48_002720 [Haemaphysalis longicornis]|uniref:Uncharacterized protein n=1 Tax=Haemaphysalis longicornis TaxID=44386 RepID=A0A9J6GMY6_HAELO|nr:hypothetical protein HPB48_002720 [Haemaphysalis longicornis]